MAPGAGRVSPPPRHFVASHGGVATDERGYARAARRACAVSSVVLLRAGRRMDRARPPVRRVLLLRVWPQSDRRRRRRDHQQRRRVRGALLDQWHPRGRAPRDRCLDDGRLHAVLRVTRVARGRADGQGLLVVRHLAAARMARQQLAQHAPPAPGAARRASRRARGAVEPRAQHVDLPGRSAPHAGHRQPAPLAERDHARQAGGAHGGPAGGHRGGRVAVVHVGVSRLHRNRGRHALRARPCRQGAQRRSRRPHAAHPRANPGSGRCALRRVRPHPRARRAAARRWSVLLQRRHVVAGWKTGPFAIVHPRGDSPPGRRGDRVALPVARPRDWAPTRSNKPIRVLTEDPVAVEISAA